MHAFRKVQTIMMSKPNIVLCKPKSAVCKLFCTICKPINLSNSEMLQYPVDHGPSFTWLLRHQSGEVTFWGQKKFTQVYTVYTGLPPMMQNNINEFIFSSVLHTRGKQSYISVHTIAYLTISSFISNPLES